MSKPLVKLLVMCTFLLGIATLQAQRAGEGTLGSWHLLSLTPRVSEQLSVQLSAQSRYYGQLQNFNQFVLRGGINYHINPSVMATLGYGFIATDPTITDVPGESYRKEHQIGEQLTLKHGIGKFDLEHRFWLEQRFVKVGEATDILHRVRYRLQLNLNLTQLFFLNFHEELFLNLQDEIFGQNRIYGALGCHVSNHLNLHAGFFRTYYKSAKLDRLRIAVFYNPDLRKKGKINVANVSNFWPIHDKSL